MNAPWPTVRLGEVLRQRKQFIGINDFAIYKRCRVQLHAKGIVLRDEVPGALIKTKRQQVCREREFLVAEIDAKVGGFGIVPKELEGSIVSSHYFLFELDETRLDPHFLEFFSKTPTFREQVSAQGSTNYAAIRPQDVLGYTIPLPTLEQQRRIVVRVEKIAAKVEEAYSLRRQAIQQAEALLIAQTSRIFQDLRYPTFALRALGSNGENPIQTGPFGAQLHTSDFVDQGIPVLNVGNIWPEGLRLQRLDHVLPEKASQLSRYALQAGDLLFARSGATLGKVCLLPKQCNGWLMTGHLFRVRFDGERVLNTFAFAALRGARSIHDQIFQQVRGATRPGYNTTLLGNVELPVPPLAEQQRIVVRLEALQAKVQALKSLQLQTQTDISSLLAAVFSNALTQ